MGTETDPEPCIPALSAGRSLTEDDGKNLSTSQTFTRSLGSLESSWGQDYCLQSAEDRVHIICMSLDLQKNLHFVLLIGRLLGTGTQWLKTQVQPWRVSVSSSQLNELQQLSGSDPRECWLHLGSVRAQLGTVLPWQKSQCLAWYLQPSSTLTSSAYLTWDWRGSTWQHLPVYPVWSRSTRALRCNVSGLHQIPFTNHESIPSPLCSATLIPFFSL